MVYVRGAFLVAVAILVGSHTASARYENIKVVGVISAIGGNLHLYDGTPFAFGGEGDIPISDMKIDDYVVNKISNLLSPRFSVVGIDHDAIAFTTEDKSWLGDDLVGVPVEKLVASLPRARPVDAYITITQHQEYYTKYDGIVLERAHVIFRGEIYDLWISFSVALIDARTNKAIFNADVSYPFTPVDASYWPENGQISPDQRTKLYSAITQLFDQLIEKVFRSEGLISD